MFGWRRRSEGFEWQEYVRTTVLIRRADRQRKIDDVRAAAINKVKDTADRGVAAGRAGVETVTQTTSQLIAAAARALWQVIATASVAAWRAIVAASATVWHATCRGAAALKVRLAALPWPQISLPKVSLPKLTRPEQDAGAMRNRPRGRDSAINGSINPDVGFKLPFNANMVGGAALVLALIFMIGPMLNSESALTPAKFEPTAAAVSDTRETRGTAAASTAEAASGTITGRATVLSGDTLRINGSQIRLAGIESPAAAQRCPTNDGRTWNCGASARSALERIARRRTVTCTPLEGNGRSVTVANCTANEADIAEALVRNGHVFAASGFFATYGSTESEARAAKVGLWQGEAKHPDEWRKDIWEDAKRAAPDGCPIKGRVRASSRVYTMPWSDGYENRVRTERGDRWFCSEEEAQAAGFTSSDRS
ncbi:MAG: thermonuclease family protein [Hyphomicrobium sp.]|nr:thermonuclease family protein [Hyphomicrobium sp.]